MEEFKNFSIFVQIVFNMKKLYYISVLALSVAFFSCEKEEIVIVNDTEETIVNSELRSGAAEDGNGSGDLGNGNGMVTDPDDNEYDMDRKHSEKGK